MDRPGRPRRRWWRRSWCWSSWSCTSGAPSSRSCRCGCSRPPALRCLRCPDALPGRDDRLLLLHHPVMQGVFGFTALQAGPRVPADDGGQLRRRHRVPAAGPPVRQRPCCWPPASPSPWPGWGGWPRSTSTSSYLSAVALPMVLIGAGQGLAFAPLTDFGIAGVRARTPAPPADSSTPPTSWAWRSAWRSSLPPRRTPASSPVPGRHRPRVGHRPAGPVPASRRGGHRPRATTPAAKPVSARSQGGYAMSSPDECRQTSTAGQPPTDHQARHTSRRTKKCEQRSCTVPATSAWRTCPTRSPGAHRRARADHRRLRLRQRPAPLRLDVRRRTGRPAWATSSSASSRRPAADVAHRQEGRPRRRAVRLVRRHLRVLPRGPADLLRPRRLLGPGGIGGGQAEAVRVPLADGTLVKLPVGGRLRAAALAADAVRRLRHRLPRRRQRRRRPGTTVTVIGDGAVGLLRGARRPSGSAPSRSS